MERPINSGIPRSSRRRMLNIHQAVVGAGRRLDALGRIISQGVAIEKEYGKMGFTERIYKGKPYIHDYLAACRQIPDLLAGAYANNALDGSLNNEALRKYEPFDIFDIKVGGNLLWEGTSLTDIEQMPLTVDGLLQKDIVRINRMFYSGFSFLCKVSNPEHVRIRYYMLALAVQKFAQPTEKINIPFSLYKLNDRLTAYFDYLTGLTTAFRSLPEDDEMKFEKMFMLMLPYSTEAVASYLPARLGITPSSAIKLFYERFVTFLPNHLDLLSRGAAKSFEESAKYAIRANNLPQDLAVYQHYNPKNDKSAEAELERYYNQLVNVQPLRHRSNYVEEMLQRLGLYRQSVYSSAIRSQERYSRDGGQVGITFPEHPFVSSVEITAQYPYTLMAILKFRDSKAYVLLEIDKDNNIYGLPPQFAYRHPHSAELLVGSVAEPVLTYLQSRYPLVERRRHTEQIIIPSPITPSPQKIIYKSEIAEIPKQDPKPQLVRKLATPIGRYFDVENPPLHSLEHVKPQRYVNNRDLGEIAKKLGRRESDKIVSQVMRAVEIFEYGGGDVKKLTDRSNFLEQRVGDFRVIYDPEEENNFWIEGIVNRKDLLTFIANRGL